MSTAIQPISVFFSYGHDSEEIVLQIKSDLESRGFRIWVDSFEIRAGNEWRAKITDGILGSDTVMAFLSSHALRKNGVCLNELSIAVGCKYGHIKTVLLEPDIEYLIPPTIANIQYCDMSRWKMLKAMDEARFQAWYDEKLQEIIEILSSKEAIAMNSQLKYLEQMLSPAMWQPRQNRELQKPYVARKGLEAEISRWLRDKKGSRTFVIYGEPGTGKSSFLINYHHFNYESGAIAFCDWKKHGRDKISEIIRSIAFQLATKISAYRVALTWHLENKPMSLQNLNEAELFDFLLVKPMFGTIHFEDEVYLILVDGMNELNDKNTNCLAEILACQGDDLPASIKFIISSRKDHVTPQYFSNSDSYELLPSAEEAISTIRDYYSVQLEDVLAQFNENDTEKILDALSEKSEGNFLYAELCAKALVEGKMFLNDLNDIPRDLNGIYYQWFSRLFPDDEVYLDEYYAPLSVLCAIDDPIPLDLLKNIMGWNTIVLHRFQKKLKDFLRCQNNAFGKPTVTLFHASMRKWLLSDHSGSFQIEEADGLEILKEQLARLFYAQEISPYQCKLLISVLEKSKDEVLRRNIYGSQFFFEQYYLLAKAYESVRSGYHKAILIYIHLKEICLGLPSRENRYFLETILPYAMSRCYCQTGDYYAAKLLLSENLEVLEKSLPKNDLMEAYYILGSVYDWFGERKESVEVFEKLNRLASEEQNSSYVFRAITGLIWGEHFSNIEEALSKLDFLAEQGEWNEVDRQMSELIRARILLSVGELNEALKIYDSCLLSFDFSFHNDIRGYRKNRLMLIEILPACYDVSKYEKGVQTGKQILKKIKNTGWLEECYCASWIAMNYLGMGDVDNAKKYLQKSLYLAGSIEQNGRSDWISMHLSSLSAFILAEEGKHEEALHKYLEIVEMALDCNDTWVAGDACFEIGKLCLLYRLGTRELAKRYIDKLQEMAKASGLGHLKLKSSLMQALFHATEESGAVQAYIGEMETFDNEKILPSTNYIDVYCIKAMVYKAVRQTEKARDCVHHIRKLIYMPEYRNRPSAWQIAVYLNGEKAEYLNFGVEYCDPIKEKDSNYWMRLEHLGRYLWACGICSEIKDAVVADMACATGYGSGLLSHVARQVFGFDRSEQYLSMAPEKETVIYKCADFDTMQGGQYEAYFDLIVSFETIEHVKYPKRLIELFGRMIKPNGTLLLSFPNALFEKLDENGLNKDVYHLHILEKDQILAWLEESGFHVLRILGQSYCNDMCQAENEALEEDAALLAQIEQRHKKTQTELFEEAHKFAIPTENYVERSYSFVLQCQKMPGSLS